MTNPFSENEDLFHQVSSEYGLILVQSFQFSIVHFFREIVVRCLTVLFRQSSMSNLDRKNISSTPVHIIL